MTLRAIAPRPTDEEYAVAPGIGTRHHPHPIGFDAHVSQPAVSLRPSGKPTATQDRNRRGLD